MTFNPDNPNEHEEFKEKQRKDQCRCGGSKNKGSKQCQKCYSKKLNRLTGEEK